MLWPVLGLVRFLLALIVAGAHLQKFFPLHPAALTFLRFSGFAAVLGFLVISGFSIAASYAKAPDGFYRRRALRILPLYVLAIAAGVLVCQPFGQITTPSGMVYSSPSWSQALQNLFFLQGFSADSIVANGVVWSLSIEVLFYLLTPLLARLSQTGLAMIAGASLLLFVLDPLFFTPYYSSMRHGSAAALLAWVWLLGFIAFRQKDNPIAALGVMGVLFGALYFNNKGLVVNWPVPIALTVFGLGLADRVTAPAWLAKLFTLLGDASFPLYLFHLPLFILIYAGGFHWGAAGYLAAALAAASLLDLLFDKPLKWLLSRAADLYRHLHRPLAHVVILRRA